MIPSMEKFNSNNIKIMLSVEKKNLMKKVTQYIGKKLAYLTTVEGLTNLEVNEIYGIPSNRVTEFQDYGKYKRAISELQLKIAIGAAMVTVKELIEKIDLTEKEQLYLETLIIHEDRSLTAKIAEVKTRGGNPRKAFLLLIDEPIWSSAAFSQMGINIHGFFMAKKIPKWERCNVSY